ncbi:leucine-rich repeat domain-containing protein [Ruminococcus sp.]|uniref:leucine-rich repeat domain-containing protein n=1 Tax=Ruminococcus sp. TaxID=41978 RepID=UPI002588CD31|nr:leucine-rich repeat domain-containing protein [Ruminococcus sp.]MCR5019976.1 leucine-rich repeat domain-containing protein [Ruminococcus sp.]
MGFIINGDFLEKYTKEEGVTRAVIPEGVKDIRYHAFDDRDELTSIHIPNSLYPWEEGEINFGLWNCDELVEITANEDNPNYVSVNGVLYSRDMTALIRCPNAIDTKRFVIPDTVTYIGDDAFAECYNIEEIVIPSSIELISFSAFCNCSSLKKVVFPKYMPFSINDDMFMFCTALEEITIPAGVTSLCTQIFHGCTSLKKITIGKDMEDFDDFSLSAPALEEFEVDLFNQHDTSSEGILYNNEKTILLRCPVAKSGDIVIPESVTQIGDECSFGGFMDCRKLKTIHVPASVKRIRKDAFQYCSAKVTYEDKDSIEFFEKKRF